MKAFIVHILERKQHPEQAYKSCMGVLSLAKKVGEDRLINACKRAIEYNLYNYKTVAVTVTRTAGADTRSMSVQSIVPMITH